MFYTDEHGLTSPTARQEQEWNEANGNRDEEPSPDEPEGTPPDSPNLPDDCPPKDDDLPF